MTIEPRHVRFHEIAKRAPPPPLLPPPPLPPLLPLLPLPLLPLAAYYRLTTTVVLLWYCVEKE